MLKDIKNTIKQSAIYGLSRVASKIISFILIPLYTAKFAADAIANINLLESFWQYLFTIVMFALETAIINFCSSEENDSKRKQLLFNFFFLLVLNSVMLFTVSILYSEQISLFILKEKGYSSVISYCFLISIFEALLIMPMTIARLNNKPILYTILTVSNLVISLLLQIYFIIFRNLNFEYVFLSKFIAPAFVFLIFIPYVINNLKWNLNPIEVKTIIKFSFPLMLAMLLSLLLNSIDRFILSGFVSKQEVAIYTTGYGIGSITSALILSPFTLAINIIFWNKIKEENFRRFMTKSSTYLFFAMIFSALIISFFISFAVKFFVRNELLWPAINIIPIILFSNCFASLNVFPSLDLYYKRRTNVILYITAVCLFFNFIMNLLFIKYFGIYASAVVTVLSYMLMIILGYFLTRSFSFMKFESYKLFLLSILFIFFVSIPFAINIPNIYLEIIVKLLLIFLFLILLYIFKFFEPVEIESIKGFFNKYLIKRLR